YELSPDFINLENGYLSPQPLSSLNAFTEKIRMINEKPSFYMRRLMEQDLAAVKKKVADFAGCTVEELVICRNTTEALNNVILGIELNPQDEILYADMEYPSMKEALEMRAKRFGTKIREIKIPVLPVNDNQVVKIYEEAISEQTKVILISHLVYLTGQVLPVKKICDMAHSKGIEVIVDGAHSFAHLNYKISELNCDYFGCSLHKWLCAPLGTGLLYIKKDKISKVWPLFGDSKAANDSIKKFEHIGTHPISAKLGILAAIDFFNIIGAQRKEDRLRFLKNYWVDKLSALKSVKINTPLKDYQSCAIALLAVKDKTPAELANYLFDKHKIFTVAIDSEQVKGVRVAPNVYTSTADLDKLVEAIKEIAE
ncbi:MAG: aminotransferase class V-fold PLP-dependent enzyme, partial [Bacteroidales bacterium]|nr:aminotransferase class V-fold PLP-dependent enzyme [Bacteroidales bacterium]